MMRPRAGESTRNVAGPVDLDRLVHLSAIRLYAYSSDGEFRAFVPPPVASLRMMSFSSASSFMIVRLFLQVLLCGFATRDDRLQGNQLVVFDEWHEVHVVPRHNSCGAVGQYRGRLDDRPEYRDD